MDGNTTLYLYEYDKVVLEVDSLGNQTATNVYGTNLISRTVDSQTLYYFYNGHADVTALMNTSGSIVGTYYYDAFGNITESTGNADNPYRYAGYQYDKETGTYYLISRLYDPTIARFLQEDTYRGNEKDPLSLNLYTYCNNEPIMYVDPTGHFWQEAWDITKGVSKGAKDVVVRTGKGIADTATYTYDFYVNQDGIGQIIDATTGLCEVATDEQLRKEFGKVVKEDVAQTSKAIATFDKEKYTEFKEGNLEKKARLVTNVAGEVALTIGLTKGLDKASKLNKVNQLNKTAQVFDKTSDLNRTVRTIDNITNTSNTPYKMQLQLFGKSKKITGSTGKIDGFNGKITKVNYTGAGEAKLLSASKAQKTGKLPEKTIDRATGEEVGRFIVDSKGNTMIEPVGGRTVPGSNPVDTHTLYPNNSNYQRLNPNGHPNNPIPHGHGHLPGTGTGRRGQGASIDVNGNVVPNNSPDAHWPINR